MERNRQYNLRSAKQGSIQVPTEKLLMNRMSMIKKWFLKLLVNTKQTTSRPLHQAVLTVVLKYLSVRKIGVSCIKK